jgi:hypothetical protein
MADTPTGSHAPDDDGPDPPGPPAPPGYEVVRELGRGGMGVVDLARHTPLDRLVALKVVLAGGHSSPGQRQRFAAEARAVARLRHPNVGQSKYLAGVFSGRVGRLDVGEPVTAWAGPRASWTGAGDPPPADRPVRVTPLAVKRGPDREAVGTFDLPAAGPDERVWVKLATESGAGRGWLAAQAVPSAEPLDRLPAMLASRPEPGQRRPLTVTVRASARRTDRTFADNDARLTTVTATGREEVAADGAGLGVWPAEIAGRIEAATGGGEAGRGQTGDRRGGRDRAGDPPARRLGDTDRSRPAGRAGGRPGGGRATARRGDGRRPVGVRRAAQPGGPPG